MPRGQTSQSRSSSLASQRRPNRPRRRTGKQPQIQEDQEKEQGAGSSLIGDPLSAPNQAGKLAVSGQKGGGGSDGGKDALKLRLDLNLEVDIRITARVHGDVTLSLLA